MSNHPLLMGTIKGDIEQKFFTTFKNLSQNSRNPQIEIDTIAKQGINHYYYNPDTDQLKRI